MLDELQTATTTYLRHWQALVAERHNKAFFEELKPVAIGWKVADRAAYDHLYAELHDGCDKIIETFMNGRWIAKLHLKDSRLPSGIGIVKLMERRPGSTDPVGLDHLDFYSPQAHEADAILAAETGLKWTHESNDVIDDYEWISIWFHDTEAKLKAYTILDTITQELQELNKKLTAQLT